MYNTGIWLILRAMALVLIKCFGLDCTSFDHVSKFHLSFFHQLWRSVLQLQHRLLLSGQRLCLPFVAATLAHMLPLPVDSAFAWLPKVASSSSPSSSLLSSAHVSRAPLSLPLLRLLITNLQLLSSSSSNSSSPGLSLFCVDALRALLVHAPLLIYSHALDHTLSSSSAAASTSVQNDESDIVAEIQAVLRRIKNISAASTMSSPSTVARSSAPDNAGMHDSTSSSSSSESLTIPSASELSLEQQALLLRLVLARGEISNNNGGSAGDDDQLFPAELIAAFSARAWQSNSETPTTQSGSTPPSSATAATEQPSSQDSVSPSTSLSSSSTLALPSSADLGGFTALWSGVMSPLLHSLRTCATDSRPAVRDHALLTLRGLLLWAPPHLLRPLPPMFWQRVLDEVD